MKRDYHQEEKIPDILEYLINYITELEKENLESISRKTNKHVEILVNEYGGTYDYITFNGDDFQFVAKNILDRQDYKLLNDKHFYSINKRVSRVINDWIYSLSEYGVSAA